MLNKVLRPAIFGTFDGMTSALGVILALLSAPNSLLLAAVGVGISGAVGMAAGEFLSDSSNGFLPSAVMGLATGIGVLLPVIPWLFTSGSLALTLSCVIVVLTVAGIAKMRTSEKKSYKRAAIESYIVVAIVAVTVVIGINL